MDEGKANANVGSPVTANDLDSRDRNRLTYSVPEASNFSINNSGQLKTKDALNYETTSSVPVDVTATDPSGGTVTVSVTVNVDDVNEAPMFGTDSDLAGPTRVQDWRENTPIGTGVATTYAATDPDEDALVWSLSGPDASDFNIGNQDGGTLGMLTFKEMPRLRDARRLQQPVPGDGGSLRR